MSQDLAKAAYWYEKAAEQGYAQAQNSLGDLYLNGGEGFTIDLDKAEYWYKKTAEQGDILASEKLKVIQLQRVINEIEQQQENK